MHALRGITLARLATFIAAQPLFSVADALAELRRRQADGRSASKFVGVFEGFVACNEAPPLFVRGRACALHSLQIYRDVTARLHWAGRLIEFCRALLGYEQGLMVDYVSQIPFELSAVLPAGRDAGWARVGAEGASTDRIHVLSGLEFDVGFDVGSGMERGTGLHDAHTFTMLHPDSPVLQRIEKVHWFVQDAAHCMRRDACVSKLVTEDSMNPQAVHVGSPVTILAELSLVPWASKADFQAVLHG